MEDNSVNENEKVKVFPNPTFDDVQLQFPSKSNEALHVAVFSVNGNTLLYKALSTKVGINLFQLDTGVLNAGVYYLQLKQGMFVFTERLIVY